MRKIKQDHRTRLFRAFYKALPNVLNFNDYYHGSGVLYALKRIYRYPIKYTCIYLSKVGLLRGHVSTRLFWGKKVRLPITDGLAHHWWLFGMIGDLEYKFTQYLLRNLRAEDVFYDVGANLGYYTSLAQELITDGEIYAFEPNTNILPYLHKAVEGFPRTQIVEQAVSDQNGETTFFVHPKKSGVGSFVRKSLVRPERFVSIPVTTITLDDFIKTHRPPTILRVDVEGAETHVIRGAKQLADKYGPRFVIEVRGGVHGADLYMPAINELFSYGYQCYSLNEDGTLSFMPNVDLTEYPDNYVDSFVFKKPCL